MKASNSGRDRKIAKEIAGEILLSDNPSYMLKRWRESFKISRNEIAEKLGISQSVISDYERGRRNPGARMIRNFVNAIIEIDYAKGAKMLEFYEKAFGMGNMQGIIDIKELNKGIKISDFCNMISARIIANREKADREIFGYTLIDSINAILNLSSADFLTLYGRTPERAMIFTNVKYGRSPMIAVKLSQIKPALIIMQGLKNADELGIKIAESENIVLAKTLLSIKEIVERLNCI